MRITVSLKHFFARFLQFPRATKHEAAGGPAPLLDFDPFWHGDHWQNLLASPMDARHYVMEDWAVPSSDELEHPRTPFSQDRRGGRRRK